jgi:hypothetical protein
MAAETLSAAEEQALRDVFRNKIAGLTATSELNEVTVEQINKIRSLPDNRAGAEKKRRMEDIVRRMKIEKAKDIIKRIEGPARVTEIASVRDAYDAYKQQRDATAFAPNSPEEVAFFSDPGGIEEQLQNPAGANWSEPDNVREFFQAVYEADIFPTPTNYQQVEQYRRLLQEARNREEDAGGTTTTATRALLVDLERRLDEAQLAHLYDFSNPIPGHTDAERATFTELSKLEQRLKSIREMDPADRRPFIDSLREKKADVERLLQQLGEAALTAINKDDRQRILSYSAMIRREYMGAIGEALEDPLRPGGSRAFSEKTAYLVSEWARITPTSDGSMFIEDVWKKIASLWEIKDNNFNADKLRVIEELRDKANNTLAELYVQNDGPIPVQNYDEKYQYLDVIVNRANMLLKIQKDLLDGKTTQKIELVGENPEWKSTQWKEHFRRTIKEELEGGGDVVQTFKDEVYKMFDAMFGFRARANPGDGRERNPSWERMSALRDVLQDPGTGDEILDNELRYWGTFFNNRQILYDMEMDYGRSRSLTSDLDALVAKGEQGQGFSISEIVDWFWLPFKPIDAITDYAPDEIIELPQGKIAKRQEGHQAHELYDHHHLVKSTIETMEDWLVEDDGIFSGNKFKEDETSKKAMKKALVNKLLLENPGMAKREAEEIMQIAYDIAELSGIRYDSYAEYLARGGSPAGNVAEDLKFISETNVIAFLLYKAYKREPFFPAQIFDISIWLKKSRARKESNPRNKDGSINKEKQQEQQNRLDNIEKMALGVTRALRTMAPLRKRHPLPTHGRNDVLKAFYPTGYDFFVRRAQERIAMNLNIENWVKGRPKALDFDHAIFGPVPRAEGKSNNRSDRIKFRRELIKALHNMFNSTISGLKTNMMLDWNDVGMMTVMYIDTLFKSYRQLDKGPLGAYFLWRAVRREINQSMGNLGSAGSIIEHGDHAHAEHEGDEGEEHEEDEEHETEPAEVKAIKLRPFLLRNLRWRLPNVLRYTADIEGINAEHPVGTGTRGPISKALFWLFNQRNHDFMEQLNILGVPKEKQTSVPQEAQAAGAH